MSQEKKNVLLVEDDPTLLRALVDAFTAEFTVQTATNGEEAFDAVVKQTPDLVLLDIILPKMDGMTLLKKLQEDARFKELPVIILTNKDDMQTVGESLEGGVQDFLVKHEWKLADIVKRAKERLHVAP